MTDSPEPAQHASIPDTPSSETIGRDGPPTVRRRTFLAGAAGSAVVGAAAGFAASSLTSGSGSSGSPVGMPDLFLRPDHSGAPRVSGLHLQFGADASSEVVITWQTSEPTQNPRVAYGTVDGGLGPSVAAQTNTYRDAKSDVEVRVHHARLTGLAPGTDYIYSATHDGAVPQVATFRTGPKGRGAFTFTSFGDQATPTLGKRDGTKFTSDNIGSPFASDVVAAIERVAPLVHLVNGDLCYADISQFRPRTWADWFENNSRSARYRAWMPALGNHEVESKNGPLGYDAYQAYFALPDNGSAPPMRGNWYAFTVGSVRFLSVDNNDIVIQNHSQMYLHGYSAGAQLKWLDAELAAARANHDIDWIVVFAHQTAFSTANGNGADLGIRQALLPLYDKYGVDLVLCGHEHHYERTYAVRGTTGSATLTPKPVSTQADVIDTSQGTVHVVVGSGGNSLPSNLFLYPDLKCRVLTGIGEPGADGYRESHYENEEAVWSAYRSRLYPYGFIAFDVDPGTPGGHTTMKAAYYSIGGPYGDLKAVDRFTLTRPR